MELKPISHQPTEVNCDVKWTQKCETQTQNCQSSKWIDFYFQI